MLSIKPGGHSDPRINLISSLSRKALPVCAGRTSLPTASEKPANAEDASSRGLIPTYHSLTNQNIKQTTKNLQLVNTSHQGINYAKTTSHTGNTLRILTSVLNHSWRYLRQGLITRIASGNRCVAKSTGDLSKLQGHDRIATNGTPCGCQKIKKGRAPTTTLHPFTTAPTY